MLFKCKVMSFNLCHSVVRPVSRLLFVESRDSVQLNNSLLLLAQNHITRLLFNTLERKHIHHFHCSKNANFIEYAKQRFRTERRIN